MPLYHASIRDVPGRGRGIVADETVSPGTVLMEDEPYAAILLAHLAKERSQHSFQKSADLLRCQACKLVWYINKDEQKADWDVHKKECKALQACVKPQYAITWFQKAPVQNMTLRLCARALFRRAIEESSPENTKEAGTNFADIFSLMDHWDELEPEKKKGYIAEGTDIVKFMDPRGRQSSDREKQFEIAARLVAKSQCNSWIAEDNGSPTGQGLYPLGSLVNHSSRKNCELSFRGKTLVLTALNQLEKDEECTLSYRPCTETRVESRTELLASYYFDIYTPQELDNLQNMVPLGTRSVDVRGLRVNIKVWVECPWEFDEIDQRLVGVIYKNGEEQEPIPDSGFSVLNLGSAMTFFSQQVLNVQSKTFPVEIDAWGSAFSNGSEIAWDVVMRLVDLAIGVGQVWLKKVDSPMDCTQKLKSASQLADKIFSPLSKEEGKVVLFGKGHILSYRAVRVTRLRL